MRPATATGTGSLPPRRCRRRFLGELCEATAISCRSVLEAEDGLAGWRYRIPLRTAIAGRPPSAGGGQFWLVLAGEAAVDGSDPLPANSCIFVGPEDPAFAGASGPVGAELLCLQFRRSARDCILPATAERVASR